MFFNKATKIVAITEAIKKHTAERYNIDKRKIIVRPNAIDTKAFSTTKEINDDNQVITNTHNHTLTTMFNNGRTLNISKITNGYELATPKIIQITNEGNSDIIFDIKLSSIKTTLLSTNNLVYTLTRDNSTSDAMSLPLSDKVIVQNLTIEPGETITFTLKVKFTGFLENNNTDNSYSANIIVEQKNNKANLLE